MTEIKAKENINAILCAETPPKPCTLVIFGASGSLSRRKLLPAIFNLFRRGLIPDPFRVIGFARSAITTAGFRQLACESIGEACSGSSKAEIERFIGKFEYVNGDYSDSIAFDKLSALLGGKNFAPAGANIFYFALPPDLFPVTAASLGRAGLVSACEGSPGCARVVVEKPFGRDLVTARKLDEALKECLVEEQIYRIDHYLGKEAVQGIMMLRFANRIFEPIWSAEHIDHIEITVAESEGVEHRGPLYERSGLMRDMFQNHLLQLLSLIAMEPPKSFKGESVRDARAALLSSVVPMDPARSARGQYEGYREEMGVSSDSNVETYAAARLSVENDRWRGMPFYLRSGKKLSKRKSEIALVFRRVPFSIFDGIAPSELAANELVFALQPEGGIKLSLIGKGPGAKLCMSGISLDVRYVKSFGAEMPEAYERLLLDCMGGDRTLFIRSDALMQSWGIVDPVLKPWSAEGRPEIYSPGSEGPGGARQILEGDGRLWRPL